MTLCPLGWGTITYVINPITAPTNILGVVELSPNSSAKGIGIQLINAENNTLISFNTTLPIKSAGMKAQETYSLPFQAAMYQLWPAISARSVEAKFNYTLDYD